MKLYLFSWIQDHDKRSVRADVHHRLCRDTFHPALETLPLLASFSAGFI